MADQVDYRDPTPNNFPQDYDPAKADPRVKLRSDSIKHKQKGVDTREAMYQALEIGSVTANEAKETAIDTASRQDESEKKVQDTSDNVNNVLAEITKNSGDTAAPEVIAARKPSGKPAFNSLGERLDNMSSKDDVFTDLIVSVDGGVQEPFASALEQFKNSIDSNAVRIGLLQDIHYTRSVYNDYGDAVKRGLVHIQHMGALSDDLDLVVYNGDLAHGREMKSGTINRIRQLVNTHNLALSDVPSLWTIGNHDDNNVYFEDADQKRINSLTLDELEQYFELEKTYGYKDFSNQKLRVITLNTFENPEKYDENGHILYPRDYSSVLSSKQLNWFANDALKVPDGYHVLIFTHAPLQGFSQNKPYPNYRDVNHDVLLKIISDFINARSSVFDGINSDYPVSIATTFAGSPNGVLIGIIAGHEHHDVAPQIVNGVRLVERTCNIAINNRQIGTVEEDAFDIVEVNTAKRTCNLRRFGAGADVSFNY